MILHICHKWLQHPYIIEPRFSNGDKCAVLWTLKMGRYTTHAQWSRGKYITPLPCRDMPVFHSSFMRELKRKYRDSLLLLAFRKIFKCQLNAICIELRKNNFFLKKEILLKCYVRFYPLQVMFCYIAWESMKIFNKW
jgi:hypothetical protein